MSGTGRSRELSGTEFQDAVLKPVTVAQGVEYLLEARLDVVRVGERGADQDRVRFRNRPGIVVGKVPGKQDFLRRQDRGRRQRDLDRNHVRDCGHAGKEPASNRRSRAVGADDVPARDGLFRAIGAQRHREAGFGAYSASELRSMQEARTALRELQQPVVEPCPVDVPVVAEVVLFESGVEVEGMDEARLRLHPHARRHGRPECSQSFLRVMGHKSAAAALAAGSATFNQEGRQVRRERMGTGTAGRACADNQDVAAAGCQARRLDVLRRLW